MLSSSNCGYGYELLPRLDEVRRNWQFNRGSDQSAEEHIQPLLESFRMLTEEFSDDPEVVEIVERETERVNDWIAEHMPDEPNDTPKRTFGDVQTSDEFKDGRSIFDDVEA